MRCLNCGIHGLDPHGSSCPDCGVLLEVLLRDFLKPGHLLNGQDYEIEYGLGQGGFGITYLAQARGFDRRVAIKEYFPQNYAMREGSTGNLITPKNKSESYGRWLTRFKREGQVLFDLNHPNIVRVLHLFEERNTVYLVMKYLEGITLREELDRNGKKGLPESQIIQIMTGLVSALTTIHNQDPPLYHLDIKPENIMLLANHQPVLIDFGSARLGLRGGMPKYSTVAGTPDYAPPELGMGEKIGKASDIYELGLVLHEMLTGKLPRAVGVDSRFGIEWDAKLPAPWQEIVSDAIRMDVESRPQNVSAWWGRYERGVTGASKGAGVDQPPRKARSGHHRIEFETVYLDAKGKISRRESREAESIIESLASGIDLEMIWIPGGQFRMGSPSGELGRLDSEGPQQDVKIPDFYLGRYPVTQSQWEAVMGSNPSYFKGANHPVENISWEDAQSFCQKLSQKSGKRYRLPSEAEWEYACRAGTTTPFHFGETISTAVANYRGQDWTYEGVTYAGKYGSGEYGEFRETTTPVDQFNLANVFGLVDMHGNVWEWCQDRWHESYKGGLFGKGVPTDGSAWESGNDEKRILRGGSWNVIPANCRSAVRLRWSPGYRLSNSGFRLALSASGIS